LQHNLNTIKEIKKGPQKIKTGKIVKHKQASLLLEHHESRRWPTKTDRTWRDQNKGKSLSEEGNKWVQFLFLKMKGCRKEDRKA